MDIRANSLNHLGSFKPQSNSALPESHFFVNSSLGQMNVV